MGNAATALGAGSTLGFDRAGVVEIDLLHDGMTLAGRSDDALVAGANAAMLGDELIQFGVAEQIDAARWRLSRCFGSVCARGPFSKRPTHCVLRLLPCPRRHYWKLPYGHRARKRI